MNNNGIRQLFSPSYFTSSNGQAEASVKLFKSVLKKAVFGNENFSLAINKFLLMYRNSTHSVTGESPAKLFLGRALRTKLDLIRPEAATVVENNQITQIINKKGRNIDINEGEKVYVQEKSANEKLWTPSIVKSQASSSTFIVDTQKGLQHKHAQHLKPTRLSSYFNKGENDQNISSNSSLSRVESENEVDKRNTLCTNNNTDNVSARSIIRNQDNSDAAISESVISSGLNNTPILKRSGRIIKPPLRYSP